MYCTVLNWQCTALATYCTVLAKYHTIWSTGNVPYCAVPVMYWFWTQTSSSFGCHSNQRMSKIDVLHTIPCHTWPKDKNMWFWLKLEKVDFWVSEPPKWPFSLLPSNQKNHYSPKKIGIYEPHPMGHPASPISKIGPRKIFLMEINMSSRGGSFAGNGRGIGLKSWICQMPDKALCFTIAGDHPTQFSGRVPPPAPPPPGSYTTSSWSQI